MLSIETAPTRRGWDCDVEIDAGQENASRHHVSVTHADVDRWGDRGSVEELVRRTFEFLLAREQPQQILKSFELADVSRYFPEFWDEMERA